MSSPTSRRQVSPFRASFVLVLFVTIGLAILGGAEPAMAGDTSTRWQHFTESTGCGDPYTRTPYMSRIGTLSEAEKILGPFGTYFGRNISQVRSRQVYWTVPFSGGRRVKVHQAAKPAFDRVTQGLQAEFANGHIYWVQYVGAFTPRTVGGSYQLSRHALGVAIDINPAQNPLRRDGKLITNMPKWFVDVWRDAGFCWGGDWQYSKDTMHFSWIGPGAGSGVSKSLDPKSPNTVLRNFGGVDADWNTILGPVIDRYTPVIADGTGNGAPDVVGLRSHPDGAVIDIASGNEGYGSCSVRRWFVPSASVIGGTHTMFIDVNGDSGQDLVVLDASGAATIATSRSEFEDSSQFPTAVPTDAVVVIGADFDGDHIADLWSVSPDGTLRIFTGPNWVELAHTSTLPSAAPLLMAAGDRDGGDVPELFALYDGGSPRVEVLELAGSWSVVQSVTVVGSASDYLAIGAGDYDGDGRSDLQVFTTNGHLTVRIGNSATGRPSSSWFKRPNPDCDEPIPLDFKGRFYDDETSVHVNGIEFIAARGITLGCNPPFNDEFCPTSIVTRAQAATFMARALKLPVSTVDYFTDDSGHVLEGAINRVAAVGITNGCNTAGDRFCPDRRMTRAEFGTFLVRALQLPQTNVDFFTDDNGHILEGPINRLAAAGITTGCNPPANDHFCPNSYLTRAESATFIKRALS